MYQSISIAVKSPHIYIKTTFLLFNVVNQYVLVSKHASRSHFETPLQFKNLSETEMMGKCLSIYRNPSLPGRCFSQDLTRLKCKKQKIVITFISSFMIHVFILNTPSLQRFLIFMLLNLYTKFVIYIQRLTEICQKSQ